MSIRCLAGLGVLLLLLPGCAARGPGAGASGEPPAPAADAGTEAGRAAILQAAMSVLENHHAGGPAAGDPAAALAAAREELLQAADAEEFYQQLNDALRQTGSDHLYVYRAGRDLYDRDSQETLLVGARLRDMGGYLFVDDVWEGGPAAQAGLLYGDELLPVGGVPARLDPLPAGTGALRLWVRRERESPPFYLDLEPAGGDTLWYLTESTRASIRTLPLGSCRVGYLHLRTFADEALVDELGTGADFKQADGMILDLRGNSGGEVRLAGEILDLLSREPSVWITYRDRPYPFPATSWNVPLVLLVDGSTRSAAEIFAAAVQARGLGTVLGEPTPGQVQGSRLFPLPDGSRLLVPVSDVILPDGRSLEGRGIVPDEIVQRPLMYAAGADPPLQRALEILGGQLACPEDLPPETFPHQSLPPEGGAGQGGGGATPVP